MSLRVPLDTQSLTARSTEANHCQQGMVFAINANANKTFDAFLATAKGLAANSSSSSSTAASPYATTAAGGGGGASSAGELLHLFAL